MQKNIFDLFLPICCIIVAFFLGYLYADRELSLKYNIQENKKYYVDISTSSKNISITQSPQNIFFRVNGEIFQTGSIDLK